MNEGVASYPIQRPISPSGDRLTRPCRQAADDLTWGGGYKTTRAVPRQARPWLPATARTQRVETGREEERWIPPPRRRRQGRRPCRRRTTSAPSATTASGSRARRTAPIGSVASPFHYPASSPFLPPAPRPSSPYGD